MIELPFTTAQINRARKKADDLGSLNRSITKGEGNFAGYLGEIVLNKHIGGRLISCNKGNAKYKYDLSYQGYKVEVKSKRRTKDPLGEWDASIADTSKHQTPDIYAFMSITFDRPLKEVQKVWLCGFITPEQYFDEAAFWKRGSRDPSNGWLVRQSCWNLPYKDLFPDIGELI